MAVPECGAAIKMLFSNSLHCASARTPQRRFRGKLSQRATMAHFRSRLRASGRAPTRRGQGKLASSIIPAALDQILGAIAMAAKRIRKSAPFAAAPVFGSLCGSPQQRSGAGWAHVRFSQTIRMLRSDGETPGMRAAWPSVWGLIFSSLRRDSVFNPGTAL